MPLLKTLGQGQGFLKAGFQGFQKSGKTYTATELALGTYRFFGNCEQIVFFDTEGGSEYIAHRIKETTGKDLIGLKSQSFSDLMSVTKEIKPNWIVLVDSVTHIWRELGQSHLARINESRRKRNMKPRFKLEFQDWSAIKETWAQWAAWYLNSPNHVIICGRAGYEYDFQTTQDDNGDEHKELVKTGIKMKTEGEFGYEPSLLVEMERVNDPNTKRVVSRRATVIGDRFGKLDGKAFINPKFKDFEPHVRMLKPGAHDPIDTDLKSDTGITESGDSDWQNERKLRTILCEEVQGLLVHHFPGQSAVDKKTKANLLYESFGTYSWTAVEAMKSEVLREGLTFLRNKLEAIPEESNSNSEVTAGTL